MTTTYDKIADTSELEWYWQFADLVLQAERTWLGEILKTRQLYRMGDPDEHGRCSITENTSDGYNMSGTLVACGLEHSPLPATQHVAT